MLCQKSNVWKAIMDLTSCLNLKLFHYISLPFPSHSFPCFPLILGVDPGTHAFKACPLPLTTSLAPLVAFRRGTPLLTLEFNLVLRKS